MAIKNRLENKNTLVSLKGAITSMGDFIIPHFQRGYEWEKNKVELFIKDFIAINKGDPEDKRFMGLLIDSDIPDKNVELLDGQQRVITSIIALAAAVYLLDEQKLIMISNFIPNEVIKLKENKKLEIKITFNNMDKDVARKFKNILTNNDTDFLKNNCRINRGESKDSALYCKQNYAIFYKQFNCMSQNEIVDFIENVFTRSSFTHLTTNSEPEAFTLFESLNYRGQQLRSDALIKNYYYHKIPVRERNDFSSNWDEAMNLLDRTGKNLHEEFLSVLWHCLGKKEYSKVKELYDEYQTIITLYPPLSLSELMKDSAAEIFYSIYSEGYSFVTAKFMETYSRDEKKSIGKHIWFFKVFEYHRILASIFLPLMLYSYTYCDTDKILSALESYIVRNVWIGEKKKGDAIDEMDKIAHMISSKIDCETILEKFSAITTNDDEFKIKFVNRITKTKENDNSDANKIKICFARIFDNDGYLHMDDEFSKYQLEHICPRNPEPEVDSLSDIDKYRFGNITVLQDFVNESLKNAIYSDKIEDYKRQDIYYNRVIENICVEYRPDNKTLLDIKTIRDIREYPVVKDGTCWLSDRFDIWMEYIFDQFMRRWPA